ncbi:hypothetical protein BU16DRAFT_512692 [Lophium mytilinum]|uniref:Uncharacterized protein n=1 Tax=Lophium mytilinum TaxID=390894 RepID=A0A6A6QQ35_9PEZI|nr:hypothetical protein BU16DRAFT_512692 [Lophium mytilinum]
MASLNVFRKPLYLHSTQPMTGFTRNGYCEVPPSDSGNHSVAAVLSDEFLDYSASQGNDLRSIGLKGGCKWCVCATRWKEALVASKGGKGVGEEVVPKVYLNMTNEKALEKISLEDLKRFAVDKEV